MHFAVCVGSRAVREEVETSKMFVAGIFKFLKSKIKDAPQLILNNGLWSEINLFFRLPKILGYRVNPGRPYPKVHVPNHYICPKPVL